jgi:hypothetical protein
MAKISKKRAAECKAYWQAQRAFYKGYANNVSLPDSVRVDASTRVAESNKWLMVIDYVVDKGWPLKEAKAYLAIRDVAA